MTPVGPRVELPENRMGWHCLLVDGIDQPILFDPTSPSKGRGVLWLPSENIKSLPKLPWVPTAGSLPASTGFYVVGAGNLEAIISI